MVDDEDGSGTDDHGLHGGEVVTGLSDAPPPPTAAEAAPAAISAYVRAAMQRDRTPGHVLVIHHPLRLDRVPRGLFEGLTAAGFTVHMVPTAADRVASVTGIRDACLAAATDGRPIDVLAIAGDGTLDHHVLVGIYWAFHPDLVQPDPGCIAVEPVDDRTLARVDPPIRRAFLEPLPTADGHAVDEATVRRLWVLRARVGDLLRRGASPARLARATGLRVDDPELRLAVLAAVCPERVTLRPPGFDLGGLAQATQERTFQGLYPFVRAIAVYPAGTASDNALFAGVPGWVYAQASRVLTRWRLLDGLRQRAEARQVRRFLDYFTGACVTVPARFSVVAFDGTWMALCSHAVGGPGSGRFFSADLEHKTGGIWGYIARIPRVVVQEGLFGSTVIRAVARDAAGRVLSSFDSQLAEALYTNRTFISGIGAVPSTDPTSFAGRSTFVVVPPIVGRAVDGTLRLRFLGLVALVEGIVKGVLGRALHLVGLDPGSLGGGGRLRSAPPDQQLNLREGDQVDVAFLHRDGSPRIVPTQVSGDPFQARTMAIRVAWGPVPMLAAESSLLLASVRRGLERLRVRETWKLDGLYIGGLYYYRHDVGERWTPAFRERTGLVEPPAFLLPPLASIQAQFLDRWQAAGTGAFVDTSTPGVQLGRRGRYAHNSDHTAHLVVLRESRTSLLVRQVRASAEGRVIHECHARYAAFGPTWVIRTVQTRRWTTGELPVILQESHVFRTAEAVQRDAPAFFPFVRHDDDQATLEEVTAPLPRD